MTSETDQPSESKPSLWERLGRGAGKGLRRLASEAGAGARDADPKRRLEKLHAELGALVFDRLAAGESAQSAGSAGDESAATLASDPEITRLVEEIRRQRDLVEHSEEEEKESTG